MCFRPSAVDVNPNAQQGTCPYCGDPIPPDADGLDSASRTPQHTRIL